jgi:hypothetical protein
MVGYRLKSKAVKPTLVNPARITGSGCDDYLKRPVNPCQLFECAWVKDGSKLPDNFRPDMSGALVIETAFFGKVFQLMLLFQWGGKSQKIL